jgi:hypothetical protein
MLPVKYIEESTLGEARTNRGEPFQAQNCRGWEQSNVVENGIWYAVWAAIATQTAYQIHIF